MRRLFVVLVILGVVPLFGQESQEKIDQVWKAYQQSQRNWDSTIIYDQRMLSEADSIVFRESLIMKSGASGIAAIVVSLGTTLGASLLNYQGNSEAAVVVSIVGSTISTALYIRSYTLLSRAGKELARERLLKLGRTLPSAF